VGKIRTICTVEISSYKNVKIGLPYNVDLDFLVHIKAMKEIHVYP
jgi:hypothetical protein